MLTTQGSWITHVSLGSSTQFSYNFTITSPSQLGVYTLTVSEQGLEVLTPVDSSLYSVTGVGVDGGGSVVFGVAPAAATYVIRRETELIQELDLRPGTGLDVVSLERQLDLTVSLAQETKNHVAELQDTVNQLALVTIGGEVPDHTHDVATPTTNGFMSASDKALIDELPVTLDLKANRSHNHDAADINTGTLSPDRLGSGTALQIFRRNASNTAGEFATVVIGGGGSGDMLKSENLAGLADVTQARSNLGLGLAATRNVGTTSSTVSQGDHVHSVVTPLAAGFISPTDKIKLDGIASGATANSADATLLNRANHTGTQPISSIASLSTELASKAASTHSHSASDVSTGTLSPDRLAPGTALQVARRNSTNTALEFATISVGGGDMLKTENLAGLSNNTTARSNLGLGNAAVRNVGTTSGTVSDGAHVHADATTSVPGFMSASDKTKLNGIATGATVNLPDTTLLNRNNHTGTQAISTIALLPEALADKADAVHTHDAAAVVAGVFHPDRLGTGTAFQVARRISTNTALEFATISVGGGDMLKTENLAGLANNSTARTNLGLGNSATRDVGTSSGTVADGAHTHTDATTSVAGFMSAADKLKLSGISAGATANSTDSFLLNRGNHTGSQPISTVAGLSTALDGKAAISHNHSATEISSGLLAPDRLAGGSAYQFYRRNAANTAGEFTYITSGSYNTNIALYGAVGDGVTDCTAAVTAAIDYLIANGGGTLRIPSGLFLCGPIVRTASCNIAIVGDGRTSRLVHNNVGAELLWITFTSKVYGLTVTDLVFTTNATAANNGGKTGVRVSFSSNETNDHWMNALFSNVWFEPKNGTTATNTGFETCCIIEGAWNSVFSNVHFSGAQAGSAVGTGLIARRYGPTWAVGYKPVGVKLTNCNWSRLYRGILVQDSLETLDIFGAGMIGLSIGIDVEGYLLHFSLVGSHLNCCRSVNHRDGFAVNDFLCSSNSIYSYSADIYAGNHAAIIGAFTRSIITGNSFFIMGCAGRTSWGVNLTEGESSVVSNNEFHCDGVSTNTAVAFASTTRDCICTDNAVHNLGTAGFSTPFQDLGTDNRMGEILTRFVDVAMASQTQINLTIDVTNGHYGKKPTFVLAEKADLYELDAVFSGYDSVLSSATSAVVWVWKTSGTFPASGTRRFAIKVCP